MFDIEGFFINELAPLFIGVGDDGAFIALSRARGFSQQNSAPLAPLLSPRARRLVPEKRQQEKSKLGEKSEQGREAKAYSKDYYTALAKSAKTSSTPKTYNFNSKIPTSNQAISQNAGFLIASDGFVEGTHFTRSFAPLASLAYKAMLVNISDIYAMGGAPTYALLNIGLPHLQKPELREIASGITRACYEFGIRLIGGDTYHSSLLSFNITVLGARPLRLISRHGIKEGSIALAITKPTLPLGGSLRSLNSCLRFGMRARGRLREPSLSGISSFYLGLSRLRVHAQDISDGVFKELNTLRAANKGLGFVLFDTSRQARMRYLSGEEYYPLIVAPPRDVLRIRRLAKRHRLRCELIARASYKGRRFRPKLWH